MRLALALTVALGLIALPFLLLGELPGERWLLERTGDPLAMGATGAALLAADVLLPVPSSVVGALMGGRLDLAPALLWTWSGLMAGNVLGYLVGRLGLGWVRARLPVEVSVPALMLSRPVPALAEAMVLAAGATGLPWRVFLGAAAVANLLLTLAFVGYGRAVLSAALTGPALAGALAIPAAAWLVWHWQRRGSAAPPST